MARDLRFWSEPERRLAPGELAPELPPARGEERKGTGFVSKDKLQKLLGQAWEPHLLGVSVLSAANPKSRVFRTPAFPG